MEPEIVVQDPPESSERVHATPEANNITKENPPVLTEPTPENPLTDAEYYLITALKDLERLHDKACETNATNITMGRTMFTEIATTIQKAWEKVQTAQHNREITILKSLKNIQASIGSLEQKYEGIQARVTENNTEMTYKLNEIQATTIRLENKHEAIERTIKEAPKTYADIIKTSTTNTKEKATAETRVRQRQQHDTLRQERAKYEVTLTTKETNDEIKELINTMPPKEITERCQHAIEKASISNIKLQGINRLANGIRIRCETEEQAEQLRATDWNEAFKGIKIHEPNYGIVINGVPINELDLDDPKTIESLEAANNLPSGTISKITFLRRKNKDSSIKAKHCSIVIYFNKNHTANKCIRNGCYINYLHYQPERFVPQFQIMQCFNCCEYGHRAANCKRKSRCGKCAGNHNTKECNNTIVQCVHCKDSHEA